MNALPNLIGKKKENLRTHNSVFCLRLKYKVPNLGILGIMKQWAYGNCFTNLKDWFMSWQMLAVTLFHTTEGDLKLLLPAPDEQCLSVQTEI